MLKLFKGMINKEINQKPDEINKLPVSKDLNKNIEYLKDIFSRTSDFIIREIKISGNPKYSAAVAYIDGFHEQLVIERMIIDRLGFIPLKEHINPLSIEYSKHLMGIPDRDVLDDMNTVIDNILDGYVIVLLDGQNKALTVKIQSPPTRAVEEPTSEVSQRGPKEGFTESIETNITLLRRRIKNRRFKTELFKIGRQSETAIMLCYIESIVNDKILEEVKRRMGEIDVDSVISSKFLQEYIEDAPLSLFPTNIRSERPDATAAYILEGRIAIVVDGTPLVIIIPSTFIDFFHSSEDNTIRYVSVTFNRILRITSLIITLTLPALYVVLLSFHQELIPSALAITIIRTRSKVPFSPIWEMFLMLTSFEIIKEAGVRIPKAAGQAISIVGALVIGEAAVQAGVVSTPAVIIVALTSLAAYAVPVPELQVALTIPRFILLFIGGMFSMIGLVSALTILFLYLMSVRSFGVPFMAPIAPFITAGIKNSFVRAPHWSMYERPWFLTWRKSMRRKPESRPEQIKRQKKRKGK